MTAADRVKHFFLREGARPVAVRDVLRRTRGLERATASKICVYFARLGWVDAKMVAGDHGRRYEFTATPALLREHPAGATVDRVMVAMRAAPGGLTVVDMRYSIRGLFAIRESRIAVNLALGDLMGRGMLMREPGNQRKMPVFVLGSASAQPWSLLDGALRVCEAARTLPRRLISSGSDIRSRRSRPPRLGLGCR